MIMYGQDDYNSDHSKSNNKDNDDFYANCWILNVSIIYKYITHIIYITDMYVCCCLQQFVHGVEHFT